MQNITFLEHIRETRRAVCMLYKTTSCL